MKPSTSNDAGATPPERSRGEQDHVDRVRAQWREVRPDLDTSPMEVVARVGRIAAYFDQSINTLMARHGLARSSWDVLASLRREGEPYELSPTELYRSLMRTSGAMTNRLHGLERAGLIERRPDPGDRRGLRVRLTKRGREVVDELSEAHMENERRLLSALGESDRDQLAAHLRQLALWLERTSPTPPRQGPPRPQHKRRH
jgi:DNA-binding MarR family transcriptional regulator